MKQLQKTILQIVLIFGLVSASFLGHAQNQANSSTGNDNSQKGNCTDWTKNFHSSPKDYDKPVESTKGSCQDRDKQRDKDSSGLAGSDFKPTKETDNE